MTPRKTAGIVAGAVAATGLAVGAVAAVNNDDPIERVGSVEVGPDPSAPSTTSTPAAAPAQDAPTTTAATSSRDAGTDDGSSTTTPTSGRNRQVVALDELTGTFLRDDDDHDDRDDLDDYEVNGRDLDFGPDDWVRTAGPLADYDGDGTVEDVRIELEGLVGSDVTLLVRFDDDDDVDVYVINGQSYRDSATGSTPWETDQARSESQQAAVDAATAAVTNAARVDDVDRNGDGSWDIEVIDDAGREHDVRVSAAGEVIRVDIDDHADDRHDDDRFDD